jgi:hypothetical protein
MKRLALFAVSTLVCGCTVHASGGWVPPPRAQVVVETPPPPPPPQGNVVVEAQPGSASVEVEVAPAPEATAEPEEVIATSEPPEPVYEEQTDAPSPGQYWVPGYWQWTGSDWGWYYGAWAAPPEGRIYVEPYYEHVNGHVVYVRGYWGAQGEEPRYYGGDRIVFSAAVRPAGYVRGQRVVVARSVGVPPGSRGHYGPKPTGAVRKRAMPTATAPRSVHYGARGEVAGHAEGHGEGHGEAHAEAHGGTEAHPEHPEAAHTAPAAKPEPRPEPKPAPKPAPKPGPKKK